MGDLLNTGMLALHSGDHRLQLLLHELGLDVTNLLLLVVNMKGFLHLGVLSVDDSESLLNVVLVDLDLREVGVNYLHGVLTGDGEGHHVIPVL